MMHFTVDCLFFTLNHSIVHQTQEREAKAEMRRKAKELQQIRRDAERGKKGPGFGGFGSSGMSSSNASIITDTLIELEKPKPTPAPVRYSYNLIRVQRSLKSLHTESEIFACVFSSSLFDGSELSKHHSKCLL